MSFGHGQFKILAVQTVDLWCQSVEFAIVEHYIVCRRTPFES